MVYHTSIEGFVELCLLFFPTCKPLRDEGFSASRGIMFPTREQSGVAFVQSGSVVGGGKEPQTIACCAFRSGSGG